MAGRPKGCTTGFSVLGLREVIPDQTGVEQWKELVLNSGGTHLTLQDIKLPEGCTAGGYCYKDTSSPLTRNRFISWQITNHVLELIEHSLDLNLHSNHLRIRFQGLAILEGTSIHETATNVIILVSTISSVHKLVLPHPAKHNDLAAIGASGNTPVPSIFTEANLSWLKESNSYEVISNVATNVSLPLTAASSLSEDGNEALFALANPSNVTLIRMGSNPGAITTQTLQPASNFSRLLSGYLPTVLRGSSTQESEDTSANITFLPVSDDVLVVALTKGLRLRIWSSRTSECRLDQDLSEFSGDKSNKQLGALHRLRWCEDGNDFKLAIFSSFGRNRSFLLLDLQMTPQMRIVFQSSLTAQHSRLIDFTLTSTNIYALWSTSDGEYNLEFAGTPNERWQAVALEPSVEPDIEYDETIADPKQAYLQAIFKPGSFSVTTLSKALQAFDRTNSNRRRRLADIKEDIIAAIEAEIQEQLTDAGDLTEEEYLELSAKCWAQFYAYVVQYHMKRPIPIGLLIDEDTGLHCLLKKGMISLLRPLDLIESFILHRQRRWDEQPYQGVSQLFIQQSVSSSVVALLEVLSCVNDALTGEQVKRFDTLMSQLQSADQIASEFADELLQGDSLHLVNTIEMAMAGKDICLALSALLQHLSVVMGDETARLIENNLSVVNKSPYRLLFHSSFGLSALAESSRQMADLRLQVCRDVLIVQQLLILTQKKVQISSEEAEAIRSEFLPRFVPLAHAYYALSWLCHYPAQIASSALVEQNIRAMNVLGFKKPSESYMPTLCRSLVELFLALEGGQAVRAMIVQEDDSEWTSPWLDVFPLFMKSIGQLLWSMGNHTTFMEFLMERYQPSAIQGYVRLQQNWCEWNTCSRKFLMAVALITTGEGDKASRWMLEASEGITKEDLLHSIVLKHAMDAGEMDDQADPVMRFHLICVELLEQAGLSSAALRVALVALNSGTQNDPLQSTMWSIVTKLHLKLGHYQEAYEAIISNPDSSQRPENLGRLVNTLLERKQMNVLLTFPYAGLEADLEKIVERRARASDILSMKVYYSFLYAFHVRQSKMRKAAAVMYEQALRYGGEGESTQMVKCLLACLNALRLVSKDEAWLVKPITTKPSAKKANEKRSVEVVEYADIEKEYEMSFACLALGQTVSSLLPTDVIALLTSRYHYESALRIARIFEIEDNSSIVEHLAATCVALSKERMSEQDAWVWLAENQAGGVGKASEQAWRLLERLLPKAEGPNKMTRCHRAVARKILELDCSLPYWLVASYKKRNPGELITLYHQVGLLEDAVQTTLDMVDAILGKGREYFGYTTTPLQIGAPPVWLPYTAIDRLVLELKAHPEQKAYTMLLDALVKKMETYLTTVQRVSREIVGTARA